MNKIYKVVWSKVKNCYVVVSEIAKNVISGSIKSAKIGSAPVTKGLALGAMMAFVITGNVWAEAPVVLENGIFSHTDFSGASGSYSKEKVWNLGSGTLMITGVNGNITGTGWTDYAVYANDYSFSGDVGSKLQVSNADGSALAGNGIATHGKIDVDNLVVNVTGYAINAGSDIDIDAENISISGGYALYTQPNEGVSVDISADETANINGYIYANGAEDVSVAAAKSIIVGGVYNNNSNLVIGLGSGGSLSGEIVVWGEGNTTLDLGTSSVWNVKESSTVTNLRGQDGEIVVNEKSLGTNGLVNIGTNNSKGTTVRAEFESLEGGAKEALTGLQEKLQNAVIYTNGVDGEEFNYESNAIDVALRGDVELKDDKVITTMDTDNLVIAGDVQATTFNGIDIEDTLDSKADADDVYTKDANTFNGLKLQGSTNGSIAVGELAEATGASSVAIGGGYISGAKATAENSVALGAGSVADEADTVSVGAKGEERRIVNVAAGVADNDAVNVDQLNAAVAGKADKATTLKGYGIEDAYTKTEVDAALGAKANQDDVTTALAGKVDKNAERIVIGAYAKANDSYSSISNNSIVIGYKAVSENWEGHTGDDNVVIGDNAQVYNASNAIVLGSRARVQAASNGIAAGQEAYVEGDASIGLGNRAYVGGKNSVALGAGSSANEDEVISVGHKVGDVYHASGSSSDIRTYTDTLTRKIINVKAGELSKTSTEAVVGSQLYATNQNVEALSGRVDTIEDDYLKSTDKTELSNAIATEKTRAEGIEAGLRTDVDAIKGDYLKAADKQELQNNIDTKADAGRVTALEEKTNFISVNDEGTFITGSATVDEDLTINGTVIAEDAVRVADDVVLFDSETGEEKVSLKKTAEQVANNTTSIGNLQTADVENLQAAKEYTDELANGAVKANTEAIASNTSAIEAINDAETGILAQAKADATYKANVAQAAAEATAKGYADQALTDAKTYADSVGEKAAQDATSKANQALADAKAYTDDVVAGVAGDVTEVRQAITAEAERAAQAEKGLGEAINAETARAQGVEGQLSEAITNEVNDRIKNDEALSSMITAEANRAAQAEKGLGEAINAETARAQGVEGQLSQAITNEVNDRVANDEALSSMIGAEAERAAQAEAGLGVAINAETARAQGVEGQLSQAITNEVNDRIANDEALSSMIGAEAERAAQAEAGLGAAINAETARAQGVEGQLSEAITNETAARIAGDEANAQAISGLNQRLGKLNGKVNKVGAGAAALAALHPLEYDPDDKLTFSAGVGNYAGENAAALGAFYRPNEKLMVSLGGTMGNGENMVNLGVSVGLDKPNGYAKMSKRELIQEVNAVKAKYEEVEAENEAMKAEMAEMKAMLQAILAKK